jgi:hypothetical protein
MATACDHLFLNLQGNPNLKTVAPISPPPPRDASQIDKRMHHPCIHPIHSQANHQILCNVDAVAAAGWHGAARRHHRLIYVILRRLPILTV